ncbi:MAG: Uncharacterized protein G01um101424_366 [Parcubacteria group bacterium Gr01-1014_24]|nr:MAG: Uncharacterized protein G01um101424_366 [Parcubacteria group bacterium Gr01-1014_24]
MRRIAAILIFLLAGLALLFYLSGLNPGDYFKKEGSPALTFWKYQCIDTMKTSRDQARSWRENPRLEEYIEREITAIKNMGANCVAIATPYDEEFVPYLSMWVAEARKKDLIVWFRGNFSGWEGWFGYLKGMTSGQHLEKTRKFILGRPDLFRDGDIFTPAPEAENGGPFRHVPPAEYASFRQFLVDEKRTADESFAKIGRRVTTNWLSVNGGLARRMLDKKTIDALGGIVTIDHYVRTPAEMADYIKFFKEKYGAKVVIGEFGAPIPDINGRMTEGEQKIFIERVFREIYEERAWVEGLNYWVSLGGSTALLYDNGSERPAADSIRRYFIPAILHGTVTNTLGAELSGITVEAASGQKTRTDDSGNYTLALLAGEEKVLFFDGDHHPTAQDVALVSGEKFRADMALRPKSPGFSYRLRLLLKEVRNRILSNL